MLQAIAGFCSYATVLHGFCIRCTQEDDDPTATVALAAINMNVH